MSGYGQQFNYGDSPQYKDEGSVVVSTDDAGNLNDFIGDVRLSLIDGVAASADVVMGDREIIRDPGLETAVLLSLFTDRRSGTDDKIPDGTDDHRGWWGDTLAEAGDTDGSLLWLESRSKILPNTPAQVEAYARAALQWMIDDGVAKSIKFITARISAVQIGLAISIVRPDGTVEKFRYARNWDKQIFGKDG